MTVFVESLKRLYLQKQIDNSVLVRFLNEQKITFEEFQYIIGGD